MGHTPGPWAIWDRQNVQAICTEADNPADRRIIASVAYRVGADRDARLIAAAPDMYAALEAIEELWRINQENNNAVATTMCTRARAALDKARS